MENELVVYEQSNLCSCYEPMIYPPPERPEEWEKRNWPEPTLENTSFYSTEPDGGLATV